MNSDHSFHPGKNAPRRGLALVLTLLVVSMLAVIVVGFTTVVRLEQTAARNFSYQTTAQNMAQRATGEAMQALASAVAAGRASGIYATQSGSIYPLGGNAIPLYSQGTITTNINSATTNGFVTGNASQNIQIGLSDVQVSGLPRPLGRIGYYIADESAKLPVNNGAGLRNTLNPSGSRPFSISGISTNLPTSAVAAFTNMLSTPFSSTSISNWPYFFTREQLATAVPGIGQVLAPRATVSMETNSTLASRTPWGTQKLRINDPVQLNPQNETSVTTIVNALTRMELTRIFGGHFGDKYGTTGVRQIAANILQLRSNHWPSNGNVTFTGTDTILGSSSLANATLAPPPTSGMLKKTNGIPSQFFGYTPFPMIRHIALGAVYGWTAQNRMSVKIFVECEIFNPFPVRYPGGGQIVAQIDKARFDLSYPARPNDNFRGPDGTAQSITPHNNRPNPTFNGVWDPWGAGDPNGQTPGVGLSLSPSNGIATSNLPAINANSSSIVYLDFTVTFTEDNINTTLPGPIYCIIDSVRLLAQPNNPQSIRDWCNGNDLFNALAANASSEAQFSITGGAAGAITGPRGTPTAPQTLPASSTLPPPTQKLVRDDPRMRPSLEASSNFPRNAPGRAWRLIPYANNPPGPGNFTSGNSTGGIASDPAFASNHASAIFNPDNRPALRSSDRNYMVGADLGKVFTGMPWRTLRMQSQSAAEVGAGLIPDWALLDVFDFSTGTAPVITPVNPNYAFTSSGASQPGFGAGIRSLIEPWTGSSINATSVRLFDPASSANVTLTGSFNGVSASSTQVNNVMTNLSQLGTNTAWSSTANGWRGRRAGRGFPQGVLMLPSEIVEVAGVSDYSTTPDRFKLNEYRSAALFPGLSAKGRFFTIYAIGQALEATDPPLPVSTVLLQTLVEVDETASPPTCRIIHQYPPSN